MKKFLCSLLFIALSLFAIDRAGSYVMGIIINHTNDVLGPKLRYLRDDIHEDVLLLGASRAHHHYVPSIMSDSLRMSVYNVGIGGSDNIFSHYIVFQHILNRYKPKVICLEVMITDYCPQNNPFTTISFFAPLFGRNEAADSIFRLAGKYWPYEISHLYRYNAKASSNIIGLALNRQKGNDNGYIPLPEPNSYPTALSEEANINSIDSLKLEYVQRFMNLCRQNGIKLVFTVSPKYTTTGLHHYDILKDIAQKNNIPFLDYHTAGLYLDHPEYFKDESHLWDKGARLYSSLFASDLKAVLDN